MLKVYIDTSVIGGCLDDEFSIWSRALFEEFGASFKIPVVADITLQELESVPPDVRDILNPLSEKIEYTSGGIK